VAHITTPIAMPAKQYLTPEQVKLLLGGIHPQRVLSLKNMTYVAGHDIRAELNRVFGFGRWDQELLRQDLICERQVKTKGGSDAFYVLYRSTVRLTVRAADGSHLCFYDGTHVGESTHPVQGDAHGNAVTNSETYALRRAAINLGDQFGLSLYNKGSLDPIVRWTLVGNDQPADTDDVAKVEEEEQDVAEAMGQAATGEKVSPVPVRVVPRKPAAKKEEPREATEITAQVLAQDAFDVDTVDKLRSTWKLAGEMGFLKTLISVPENKEGKLTREKMILEKYLLRRSDQLSTPKGDPAPEGPENAGSGVAGS